MKKYLIKAKSDYFAKARLGYTKSYDLAMEKERPPPPLLDFKAFISDEYSSDADHGSLPLSDKDKS